MRKIIKTILFILGIPLLYMTVSLILTFIPVNISDNEKENTEVVYLSSNGVHLDIVLKKEDLSEELKKGLVYGQSDHYFSFGWGDREFYLNTPTWSDLTLKTAFTAVFLNGPSVMHITRHKRLQNHWVKVELSRSELHKINALIQKTFDKNPSGKKVLLIAEGYSSQDEFYRARGSYSWFKTCNSWVNTTFKKSGLKSCLWTPFDFGLLHKYR